MDAFGRAIVCRIGWSKWKTERTLVLALQSRFVLDGTDRDFGVEIGERGFRDQIFWKYAKLISKSVDILLLLLAE
jgi:hypothetical protein